MRLSTLLRSGLAGTLFVCVMLPMTGCDNTVRPFAEQAEPYSIYGALSFKQERKFVRVKPLQTPISALPNRPLPATVTLTNQSTGATTTLQDSVIVFGDATVTHNYWTDIELEPRTEYQLTVKGPKGTAQATTLTPTNTEATIAPAKDTPGPPSDTVSDDGNQLHCLSRFTVSLREAKIPEQAEVGFRYNESKIWISQAFKIDTLDGNVRGFRFIPETLLSRVQEFSLDDPTTCKFYESRCQNLTNGTFRIAYTYLGPRWVGNRPSGGGFDPTTSGRLEDGLGFFGSYFRDTLSVTINRGTINLGPEACGPP